MKTIVDITKFESKCEYDQWFISNVIEYFNHWKVPITKVELLMGYNEDNSFLYSKPNDRTQWVSFQEAINNGKGEQDLMQLKIHMDNLPEKCLGLIDQLRLRCRDGQWPYEHKDWNWVGEAYTTPWYNWTEEEHSCKHYSLSTYNAKTKILTITWAPCWCS